MFHPGGLKPRPQARWYTLGGVIDVNKLMENCCCGPRLPPGKRRTIHRLGAFGQLMSFLLKVIKIRSICNKIGG